MSDSSTNTTIKTLRPHTRLVERLLPPRESEPLAFGKLVVAQPKVSFAVSETDSASMLARSASIPKMREQSLATIVRTNGRALAQTFEMAIGGEAARPRAPYYANYITKNHPQQSLHSTINT